MEDPDGLSLARFKMVSRGEPPCFTNLADADNLIQTMCLTAEAFRKQNGEMPYTCVAAKHGNPCGMAIDRDSPSIAVRKALYGNPRAIWGGEVVTNFPIDAQIAQELFKSPGRNSAAGNAAWMLDIVVAPAFDTAAIEILGARKQRKLMENRCLLSPELQNNPSWAYRFVRGGFLRQQRGNMCWI
jgi:AICAR transformylase/IMP cyclohydrolase PurH